MPSRSRHAVAGWAAVLALALIGVATTADAQDTKPAPGCAGVSAADPKGDATRSGPIGTGDAAAANLDITNVFFTHEKGKTYANMQLADAHDTMPQDANGVRWYVNYTAKGAGRWVRASRNIGGDTTFAYGHFEDTSRVQDEVTDGKFFTGADGVLRILVPSVAGGGAGSEITKMFADTAEVLPDHTKPATPQPPGSIPPATLNNKLYGTDRAPDGENTFGADYRVGACAGAAPNAGSGVGTSPGGGGTGPGGGTAPPAAGPMVEPSVLPVKVATKGGSARKVAKKRKLALSIQASQPVRDVVAKLFTGDPAKPKVIAQAKLAQLSGKGRLSFKVKQKLKRGTVSLRVDGTLSDGRKGIANFKVKFGR